MTSPGNPDVGALVRQLLDYAACAKTRGTARAVNQALNWGLSAAEAGRPIALPILLDAAVLLTGERKSSAKTDPTLPARNRKAMEEYDKWLELFHVNANNYAGDLSDDPYDYISELSDRQKAESGASLDAYVPDYLAFLALAAPDVSGKRQWSVQQWAAAYSTLREQSQDVLAALKKERGGDEKSWTWWTDRSSVAGYEEVAGMWSRFAAITRSSWLQEDVDHIASEVYLRAKATPLTLSQMARIARLQRRRREIVSHPHTTSYEELDPYQGAIPLSILCMGKYGLFKIVNHSAVWISDPPSALPPLPIDLHLTWASGYSSLWEVVDPGLTQPGSQEPNRAQGTAASVLQGLVALLIDDWRWALQSLPVLFYLNPGVSADKNLSLGRGGGRWIDPEASWFLPPPRAIACLFQRRSHVEMAAKASWQVPRNAANTRFEWWCGCMVESDLPDFGFSRNPEGAWTAASGNLPECLTHVITLDPGQSSWAIFRIDRRGAIVLRNVSVSALTRIDSYPYHDLRSASLDLVLSVLEARLH